MNHDDQRPDCWHLVFVVQPGEIPAAIRVRHLLKTALRTWGLKCVEIRLPEQRQGGEGEAK